MKLLISCVNTSPSLFGYDWGKGEIFWIGPSNLDSCSICYHERDLLISNNNFLHRISPQSINKKDLKEGHDVLMHSVHAIDDELVGIADTGNSRVLIVNKQGEVEHTYTPVSHWRNMEIDAIHLNDFVLTPYGILSSCFDYRPWRKVQKEGAWTDWCTGGYGLIINLSGENNIGKGRIVGCGFNHPHSLHYISPYLYVCSSATGIFHVCAFAKDGTLHEVKYYKVTKDHFLRGALKSNNGWFLGGSTTRHGEKIAKIMEIYFLNDVTGAVEKKEFAGEGEIYDILPWKDEIMELLIKKHF